jgi:hypothetical protein
VFLTIAAIATGNAPRLHENLREGHPSGSTERIGHSAKKQSWARQVSCPIQRGSRHYLRLAPSRFLHLP